MNKRVALLLNLAVAALLAGPAFAADGTAAPAKTPTPAFSTLSSAKVSTVATPAPTPAAPKIGYVDLTRVATESKTGKAAKAELVAKSEKLRARLAGRQSQLEKQKKEIEAKLPTMTQQQRATKGKEFQKKVEAYQNLVRTTEKEMQEAEEKVKTTVLKEILQAATDYGKRNGFAAVIAKEQILYLSDSVVTEDITDKVSKAIDEKKAAK